MPRPKAKHDYWCEAVNPLKVGKCDCSKKEYIVCKEAYDTWLASDEVREGIKQAILKSKMGKYIPLGNYEEWNDAAQAISDYLSGRGK